MQIAGFRKGMIEKVAKWTDIFKNPLAAGIGGAVGGAGLGVLGTRLYDKLKGNANEELADTSQQPEYDLTPEEYQQLMAMYSQPNVDPYSMYY